MKVENLTENIFHVNFLTQEELCSTFLRFQEHYESPEFKGKVFTLEEYKIWYINNSPKGKETREFTYYTDWNGFNIPSYVLNLFFDGKFNPLSEKEAELLELFKGKSHPFYIIGTSGEIKGATLKHEIAHGLFYTDPEYRSEILRILLKIPKEKREEINRFLQSGGGYHPEVWEDETHAYVMYNLEELEKKGNINISDLSEISKELNSIFEKYNREIGF